MADDKEIAVTSDTEGPEKTAREQLKKAKIHGESSLAAEVENGNVESSHVNGQPAAEVSGVHEEDTHGRTPTRDPVGVSARHHSRKRSRDSTAEEDDLNNGSRKSGERGREDSELDNIPNGATSDLAKEREKTPERTGGKRSEAAVESMTSPKTKKSRLHSDPNISNDKEEPTTATAAPASTSKDTEEPITSIPSTSGFANTSASSPFASLANAKSPSDTPQTSSSAFAASGFGSLAGSSASGFGAVGKSSGGFGTGGSFASGSKTDASAKAESISTFGGALGQQSAFSSSTQKSTPSVFASPSGFGTLGSGSVLGGGSSSGFGSLGGGGGLTSFASGKPSASLAGPSKPRSFGAPANEAEDGDEDEGDGDREDDTGAKSPLSQGEADRQDDRFYAQSLETGEEDEVVEYSCRAKLYSFVTGADGKKEWKERGFGTVKLNTKTNEEDGTPAARLLMRAEGSHRVILNTPVKKELKFGAVGGGPPQGGLLLFMSAAEGKQGLETMQLKVRQQFATELYERIVELQAAM